MRKIEHLCFAFGIFRHCFEVLGKMYLIFCLNDFKIEESTNIKEIMIKLIILEYSIIVEM